MLISGLSHEQVDVLDHWVAELAIVRGKALWLVPGLNHPSAVMAPPRHFTGTRKLFDLLDGGMTEELDLLARAWASQPFIQRIESSHGIMRLKTHAEIRAAEMIIEGTGIQLELLSGAEGLVLVQKLGESGGVRTRAQAFEWVLALVWVFQRHLESIQSSL